MSDPAMDGHQELRARFAASGLPVPPVPTAMRHELRSLGEWLWGTVDLPAQLYDLELYVERAIDSPDEDSLWIGHDGYGANNWHLHYYLASGPLAVFLQLPWGGAFQDREESLSAIATAFEQLGRLLAARSRIHAGRLIVVQSGHGRSRWARLADDESTILWNPDEDAVERALQSLLGEENSQPGDGG